MKNFSLEQADVMAAKLITRLEKRMKREGLDYVPLYLIEKAGEGIILLRRQSLVTSVHLKIRRFLTKWTFQLNLKATLRWRRWIGKGMNPDYTQPCNACPAGNCATGESCLTAESCRTCPQPSCPSPLPHSHLITNTCACAMYSGCLCSSKACKGTPGTCSYSSGTCSYNCDIGFKWDGVQCVPKPLAGLHPSKVLSHIING